MNDVQLFDSPILFTITQFPLISLKMIIPWPRGLRAYSPYIKVAVTVHAQPLRQIVPGMPQA